MPIHLTEQDLVRHPHIRQLVGDVVKEQQHPEKKPQGTPHKRAANKYKNQYEVLRAGVLGFSFGTIFMGIMMIL